MSKKEKDNFFLLRLYVAGESQNSLSAISNLNTLVKEHLSESHKVEIIDTLLDPIVALEEGIIVTPTLVKIGSLPIRLIIGDLSDQEKVLQALGSFKKKRVPDDKEP